MDKISYTASTLKSEQMDLNHPWIDWYSRIGTAKHGTAKDGTAKVGGDPIRDGGPGADLFALAHIRLRRVEIKPNIANVQLQALEASWMLLQDLPRRQK